MTPCSNCAGTEYERECRCEEGGDVDVAQKERHKTAKTPVEVFRLFKVRDLARAIRQSTDPVVAQLGEQMVTESNTLLKPYCDQQQRIIERDKAKAEKKAKRGTKAKAKR